MTTSCLKYNPDTAFDMYFAVTIGRKNSDEVKKGKDPLAVYDIEKYRKRHEKKVAKKGKKHKKAA